ncbi:molecular chaperone Tir [Streptomyces dioscori]|uniref:Molecular chaperone Tir n=1 Tax=Streptomyces dioscori TaxID=2109333 RepID=A0A2P8QCU6_9ACTN|nr:toll/interleukin-1 receptor domain-containing protein [Streptomyces dioscori]PSM44054.1 molecular chaperone Tir [Streptomyces dioscori]
MSINNPAAESRDVLAAALQDLHRQAGKPTLRALAERIGTVSHTTVADALRGKRQASWATVNAIVRELDGDEEKFRRLWQSTIEDASGQRARATSPHVTGGEPIGFWCYSRRDDELDGGRITRLAQSIAYEFEIITGEELKVFLDDTSISWGESWRARIDMALSSVTFLIPIVTPRFLKSQECRKEVITFAGHATSFGLEELLLPIHYVNVPQLTDGESEDEVAALIARRQMEDWRELRLDDEKSPRYRQAIHKLALRISEILEEASVPPPPVLTPVDGDVDEPGFIEVMAAAEAALPKWQATVEEFAEVTQSITAEIGWATHEMNASDARGGGFAGRVRVTQELAKRLTDPVRIISLLGAKYSTELLEIDPGIISLIRQASEGVLDEEDEEAVKEFIHHLKELVRVTQEVTPQLKNFSEGARQLARGSRHIRPLMNDIDAALQKVVDGQTIIDEWDRLIEEFRKDGVGSSYK